MITNNTELLKYFFIYHKLLLYLRINIKFYRYENY